MSVVPSASLCRQNLINITQTNIQMNILFRYPTSHLELLSLVFRNKHYQISAKEDRANQLLCCILLHWGRAHKYYEICLIHQPSHDKIGYCLHQFYRSWLNGYHIFFLSKTSNACCVTVMFFEHVKKQAFLLLVLVLWQWFMALIYMCLAVSQWSSSTLFAMHRLLVWSLPQSLPLTTIFDSFLLGITFSLEPTCSLLQKWPFIGPPPLHAIIGHLKFMEGPFKSKFLNRKTISMPEK